jgi:hypothetical protein
MEDGFLDRMIVVTIIVDDCPADHGRLDKLGTSPYNSDNFHLLYKEFIYYPLQRYENNFENK